MSDSKMTYVRLGKSGLKVSRIILGCLSYGDPTVTSWKLDEKTGIEHIKYAYENGINTFDTADTYSAGKSEIILGKALKEINCPRESVVILTKVFFTIGGPEPPCEELERPPWVNAFGLSRKHIFDSVQASLKRLQLDYIDVLQCHRFDYDTPIEETMQALHDVVKLGWVRYIGMSSCWAYQFQAMQRLDYAISHGLTPFISMQNFHNAAYREEEREMVPTLKMFGVGMIPWSPLCRGFLARPWTAAETERVKSDPGYKSRNLHSPEDSRKQINERVSEIAKKRGITMAQVALAWSLANDFITAPIVGTSSLQNMKELIAGASVVLTEEEKKYLDEPYTPLPISGHS